MFTLITIRTLTGNNIRISHFFLDSALRNGDLEGCAQYLDSVGSTADVAQLWRQLAEQALKNEDVQVQYLLSTTKKYKKNCCTMKTMVAINWHRNRDRDQSKLSVTHDLVL